MTDGLTASDVALLSGNSGNNNSGWGGDWMGLLALFFLFSMFGWGGFGGWGGGFGGNGGGAMQGYATQADIQRGFDTQAIVSKLDGISNGICDSTFAVTGAVNNLGTTVMQGFSQAEIARCNSQAQIMQQLMTMMFNAQQCCCEQLRAIDGVNFNMAQNTCNMTNTMNNNTRDIIDAQNATGRAILDKLCQMEYNGLNDKYQAALAENQSLRFAASQTAQNAFITANQQAQTAELIRRLGAECPQPAYIVQPPQPVSFPLGCNGQLNVWGNNGCGNGCGNC